MVMNYVLIDGGVSLDSDPVRDEFARRFLDQK